MCKTWNGQAEETQQAKCKGDYDPVLKVEAEDLGQRAMPPNARKGLGVVCDDPGGKNLGTKHSIEAGIRPCLEAYGIRGLMPQNDIVSCVTLP